VRILRNTASNETEILYPLMNGIKAKMKKNANEDYNYLKPVSLA